MAEQFDPYYRWLGIPPEEQPANHYRLLGIKLFEDNPDVIEAAGDRQMGHLRTYQAGKHSQLSQKLLNEVAAAKICLLQPDKKAAYDTQLRPKKGPGLICRNGPEGASHKLNLVPFSAGSVFGEYMLLDQLGRGGTGQVFKAKHRTMGRVVAIKVLSSEVVQSPERVARFHRKVRILAQLHHPNLVAAYDAGQRQDTHYLIMEYVDGQDLWALVKRVGPLPVEHALSYTMQAAAGLACAHSHGIYHRNIKPSNLLVDKQGVVKVIGLGLARVDFEAISADASFGAELTAPGRVMGTFDYMPPEQAVDSTKVDHRSDIYALGCTLCTVLTGHPPYPVKSQMKKVLAHREGPIPSLFELRPDVPFALDTLFRKMLAKQPDDRPQSMDQVIAALQGC